MASLSGLFSSLSIFKFEKFTAKTTSSSSFGRESIALPNRLKFSNRCCSRVSTQSVAREIPVSLSRINDGFPMVKEGLQKDPRELWGRYVDWLYQHKELGLYLDVSRIGFTDEFVEEMEHKFQAALRAMEGLDKGAIANPNEGQMVGHYWLRNPKLAPRQFLRLQIENTLEAVCNLADDVVSGKNLSTDLVSSMGPSSSDVCDFTAFLLPVRTAITKWVGSIPMPSHEGGFNLLGYLEEIELLHGIFTDLLGIMENCLHKWRSAWQ